MRLAAVDPANATWQRDLSDSRENLGDVAVAAGDLAAARAAYQASLDIRRFGQVVQDSPWVAFCWGDVPDLSYRVGSWLWPWQQSTTCRTPIFEARAIGCRS